MEVKLTKPELADKILELQVKEWQLYTIHQMAGILNEHEMVLYPCQREPGRSRLVEKNLEQFVLY